jgi:hypothetical protein
MKYHFPTQKISKSQFPFYPFRTLLKIYVGSCNYRPLEGITSSPGHLQVNDNKTEICKLAASRFLELVTHKEMGKIKINSVPKNIKDLCKNTKTIIHHIPR